jgi:hypothetical protein
VCPSSDLNDHALSTTKNPGGRVIDTCEPCPVYVSATTHPRLEGVNTPVSVIWPVLQARTEGLGCTAAARTFEKAKKTLLAWERTCVALHPVLCLSALVHAF